MGQVAGIGLVGVADAVEELAARGLAVGSEWRPVLSWSGYVKWSLETAWSWGLEVLQ